MNVLCSSSKRDRKTPCRRESNFDQYGFTLIELIVVIVLLSVMTGFAVPAIRTSLFSDQLKITARKLVGLINETAQSARHDRQEYMLRFDRDSHSFRMESSLLQEEDHRGTTVRVPDDVEVVDFLSVHGGENTAEPSLRFSPKGYVDKTLIHLRDDEGREMTISLSPFLGLARLYDSYRTLEDDA